MPNLSSYRQNDKTIDFTFTDGNGDPIDLTDTTLRFEIRPDKYSNLTIISKTVTSHTDPTQGETQVSLSNDDQANGDGDYFFEAWIIDSDSQVITTIQGVYTLNWSNAS